MEEGGDSDSDKTVLLEDYHKILQKRLSKNHAGCVQNAATGLEEGGDSESDKTLPLTRLTEEHGGHIQNVAPAPNEYQATPKAYIPSYALAREIKMGKQLVLSRFLGSNFERLVMDSSSNDYQENQYNTSNIIRYDYQIKREILNQVSEDVQYNTRHTDKNIIVIDSSDDEHFVEFDYKSDQKLDEKKYPSPLNTPVTIKNVIEMGDLELTANDVPPPIAKVNKPKIRIKVLNPKAINEQAEAKICNEVSNDDKSKLNKNTVSLTRRSDGETMDNLIKDLNPKAINEQAAAKICNEVSNDDKTKLNKNTVSSTKSSDGESMDNLIKDLTTLCKSNNSTVYAPTSNENVSSSSDSQTVAKNTSDKIPESTNKNWNETATPREDNTRNIKVNTTEIVAKSSTAETVKLPNPENSKSEKGNRYVESNRLLNMNAEETKRQANRLSDKDTLPTTCKRVRTDHEESTKNTTHSVCNNDIKVDSNTDLINTNILDLCTNTHQKNSQIAVKVNEQKEKETSNTQNSKEFVNDNTSCGDNLKNLNEKKSISKFLSRFCTLLMKDLLEKWKSLSEDAENKNAFSKSARLLADEIQKLDALEKADFQLNCPVCSRISTFTGIGLYDYYNHDTEGKQQNRFKKCYLCYGFQKTYNSMIKPLLPIQSNKSDGAKSFESNHNIHSQKGLPITQQIGTPLKYNKAADNEATVNSLSKSELSVLDISSKRDNDKNRNECSVESINNKNKLENIKHNPSLPESVNEEIDTPNSFATLENKNNISQRTDSLTLKGNISTVATKNSVGSEATSIETLHIHPVDVIISTSLTSKNNNDLEHIVDNLKSNASNIPALDTNLTKIISSENLDNVDKYHKVENYTSKTNIPNNEQGSKLISTTTSVDFPIVKTPVTEPKRIFVEIKASAKDMSVDRDSRSATPLPIMMEKINANVLLPGESAVNEGTNKPVIEKSTKKAYDVNKTIPNNNDTIDHKVDNLTADKCKNKEMHIKPVERNFLTKTSNIDLPSTLSNEKANTSKDKSVKLKDDSTNRPIQIEKLFSGSTSVTTQKSSTNVHDVNISMTFDNDISDHRVDSNTTEVKNSSDTVKARRKSKETSSRSVSENPIGKTPVENLPFLSKDKDNSTYKLGNITTETPKVIPGDRCLSEESSVPNMAAKSKNDGTNQLKTADRLGGKSTLVTSAMKPSSGTDDDTILFKASNDKDILDHRVDSITTEVESLNDTAKARRNSKEMSGRSAGENPIGRTQGVHLPSKSKYKGHSNDKLGNIKASTAISVDTCQNISKDDSSGHLKKTGDELVSKATSIKFAIKPPDQRVYDVKISKISSDVDVSDHSIDNVYVPESKTTDTKVQNKQLSKGVHKRRVSSKLNNEDLCNTLQSDPKKQKIGTSLVNLTLSKDSSGVVEETQLTKEKSLLNIHPKTNNDVSNSKNSIPKEANTLTLRAGDKKKCGRISAGTRDSISSKRPNSAPSNNNEVLNCAVDSFGIEKKDERKDVFIASPHPNDKNFKIHALDRVSKTTTAESVHSLVPKSNNNHTNLNISDVHAKTNSLLVKASKRRISTDISVFNTPPKIYKDQIGNTTVRSIPSKPEASKESIITSIPAELKSNKSNYPVILDPNAADIVSTNNPNKNAREGIFIDDEASTKIYYDNMHQRVDRVVTEANHFALEAENNNHPSNSFANVPTEAAKCRNNNPTAMSSREILARLLPIDEDDGYKNTCEISKTNKRNIANDETQKSPKRMKTNDVKFRTNDDVGNTLSNKSPKNDIEDAMNHALTVNEPLTSVHLSCKNNPIESHVETTTKKSFDDSSNAKHDKGHIKSDKKDSFSRMRELLLCEDDEVIKNPCLHSTDISVSNDNQTKHITSVKDQNNKLTEKHTAEESNNVNANKATDDHKPNEACIVKKANERQEQENEISHETSKIIKKLENDENRDRVEKVAEEDSAKGVAENSDGDSANGSVNVKETEASRLVLNSLENRQEKSATIVEAETLFLETSKVIINSKIIYECPICSCIFQDSNIYLGHLNSDHNLSTPVVPETVELNNNSNQNDEAESVNKLKQSVTNTEVNVERVERVSTPHGREKYIYKCSICKDILHTYYSARTHKSEFHPKKKYIKIYERILVDETEKQIIDTNHTSDDDDNNNENKEATENEVCDEDTNIEGNSSSDDDENNEVRSNMSNNNVVIISDEEAVDEQSSDVEQQKISDVSSSSPGKNNHEKDSQRNGKICSTSDSNANSANESVVCQADVSDENEQSLSDKVNHVHEISFSKQDNIRKSIDEPDTNSVNKDSKIENDIEVEEETREGRNENNDEEQSYHRRNIEPNDDNVIKFEYKCKICNVVCRSKYASLMHRKIKHFQMRNRQLFDRVVLCNRKKKKNINSVGKSIPIGEGILQSVSIDNHENWTKEKAQTEDENNQQKNKQMNSEQEHQGKERDNDSSKTNGDKFHTNNHDSTEKLSNAPESSSSTRNSHNFVKKLWAGISHVNQKGIKESNNNEDQIKNQIIYNSNDNIVDRQILSATVSSNFSNKLSSHDPMEDNVDDDVQKGSKQKEEDKTNDKQTVHDSETNNRQTGDEITQNQSDHKIIESKKLPASPDAYVLSCLECGYTTEICDNVIRHCQNHYNDVKDPTTHCTICRLNFDTDNFESHQNLHSKHVAFQVVKYSYKSLFSDWDQIFDEIPTDTVKDFRKESIYKTNCIKMVVTESGPWEDTLYLCGECSTCVPPQQIEQHFQENCYFVSYPCPICKRYFTSLEMLVEHERNHAKSYRVIAFNNIKDKNFNCKLLEARKNQQDLVIKKVLATIYKCACELCFATSSSFKIHFIECDFTRKYGVSCSKCTVPLHFQSTELENHEELHHSAKKCKLLVYHVTVNEEKVPDEDDGNDDNTKDTTVSQPKGFLDTEMDIKRDLLKHDATDSQED